MGAKQSYGSVGRGDQLNFLPETLKVITDPKHPLYDPRVEREPEEGMILSIMRHGVIVPLVIARDGDSVYVVDGRQRRACAIEANKRLKKEGGKPVVCPCVWKRGDDAKLYEISVTTNEVRTGDSPLERAAKMQHLLDLVGGSLDEVAVGFGCTVATVKNTLALLECAPPVQRAVESGKLGAIHATKLSKLPREEQVETLDKMIAAGATKGSAAQKAVKKKGDVEPVQPKATAKDRERVMTALLSIPYAEKSEAVRAALAAFRFIDGDLNAFRSWKDIAQIVDDALNPPKKSKKGKKARKAEASPEATA